ncbi:MAG: hypothetical protein P1R58_03105 [bacterium]|nr:hypothetical protein [bacterium]
MSWPIDMKGDTVYEKFIIVDIPSNDTSFIQFRAISSQIYELREPRFFVTTGDTLQVTTWSPFKRAQEKAVYGPDPNDPSTHIPPPKTPTPNYSYDTSVFKIIPLDSARKLRTQLETKTDRVIPDGLSDRDQQRFLQMVESEKTVLSGTMSQTFFIGDKVYHRKEGERYFYELEPYSDMNTERALDSARLANIDPSSEYHALFLIDETWKLGEVETYARNLERSEFDSFYSGIARWSDLKLLWDKGIKFKVGKPIPPPDSENNRSTPDIDYFRLDQSLKPSEKKRETIWAEGFESGWPLGWYAYDDNPMYGEDFWDISTLMSYGGSRSIWCAGYGSEPDGSYHDGFMYSWAFTPYIDTYDHGELRVSYRVWYDIDPFLTINGFALYVSEDGGPFIKLVDSDGISLGWEYYQFAVYGDDVKFGFRYSAGDYFVPQDRGAYVDDIVLTGIPKTNLRPSNPGGSGFPIGVSSDSTIANSTVYAGEPVYIDWAIQNSWS